jgi:hypothetical protein
VIVCIAEDRSFCEISVKLLLLSLAKHCANAPIHLFFPAADRDFICWIRRYRNVTLYREKIPGSSSFNVKPQALLSLMDNGYDDIVWIDSDIIVVDDISDAFQGLDYSTFVVAEEALWSARDDRNGLRARLWGFEVGRILPFALNSCVIRATASHRGLLERWQELLQSEQYREVQRLGWQSRPVHMLSDQDVLSALLAGAEYSVVPIKILERGKDIVQYFGPHGYTVAERLANLAGYGPKFVHSQGTKPWAHKWERVSLFQANRYFKEIYLDLSPYTIAAAGYRLEFSDDTSWLRAHFVLSRIMRLFGAWSPPLVGLPLAIAADMFRVFKKAYLTARERNL